MAIVIFLTACNRCPDILKSTAFAVDRVSVNAGFGVPKDQVRKSPRKLRSYKSGLRLRRNWAMALSLIGSGSVAKADILDAPNQEDSNVADIGNGIFRSRFIAGFEGMRGYSGRRHCGANDSPLAMRV